MPPDHVARIVRAAGTHARHLHDLNARDLQVTSIQADERHGFVGRKKESVCDATVIDPSSKFLIQDEVGERTATLAQSLLVRARERLTDPHGLVLFTGGFLSYQTFREAVSACEKGDAGAIPEDGLPDPAILSPRPDLQGVRREAGRERPNRDRGWDSGTCRRGTAAVGLPQVQHLGGGASECHGEADELAPGEEKPREREAEDAPGEPGSSGAGALQLVPSSAGSAEAA